ncbi:MAG: hypothetical protein ABMA13_10160 [Chthoniobacteraceae bacterium]
MRYLALLLALCVLGHGRAVAAFSAGELVRLTRGEMLQFKGDDLVGAAKGQELNVLKHDVIKRVVFLAYYKSDALIAVTLPDDAVEASPRTGWLDLLDGAEAFRGQRYDEAKRLLGRATQDAEWQQLASTLLARITVAVAAARTPSTLPNAIQGLRESAAQLEKLGHATLALAIDEGADRLGATPATMIDRGSVAQRASLATRAVARCRQAVASHRMFEAQGLIETGLKAEPARPELKAFLANVGRDVAEADERFKSANSMRRFEKGTIHALTAIEMGLKACADHPKLVALKKEMQGAFEERTSPPLSTAMLALAKGAPRAAIEEGRQLYTTRCTECHDLELLDSRSLSAWERAVGGMAARAKLTGAQRARILEYIAVAQASLDAQ